MYGQAQDLLAAFPPIAIAAEHLAVVGRGVTALRPRGYMIGFHMIEFIVLAAVRTDTLLFLVLSAADLYESLNTHK